MSAISSAASGKAQAAKLVRQASTQFIIGALARYFKRKALHLSTDRQETNIHNIIFNFSNTSDWTDEEIIVLVRKSIHKAFGDPMALTREQLKLRQYSTSYYNPTANRINVFPLGLPDEEGKVIHEVVSGGIIGIPHSYTIGGRYSTIGGVAPQLKPMPKASNDVVMDLTPSSYAEWITYMPFVQSQCHKQAIVWSDAKQSLLCQQCKETICQT